MRFLLGSILGLCSLLAHAETVPLSIGPAQGGEVDLQTRDDMPLMKRLQVDREIQANIAKLRSEGRLLPSRPKGSVPQYVTFPVFPLRARAEYEGQYQGYFQLVNYVDLNPTVGGTYDYNCGARTYDGHQGIDYTLWPFPWWMMDQSVIEVIAAEHGQIVGKFNGNNDRSCPGHVQGDWNGVVIRHTDAAGTLAYYAHMKNGSLTSRNVGDFVNAGDYLGLVGSSGFSSHPHLHFEFQIPGLSPVFQEPHAGSCRSGNTFWVVQRPYRDSRINMALAHNAVPDFNAGCPNPFQETRNVQSDFIPGATVFLAAYLSDEQQGQVKSLYLFRPDGLAYSWNHTSPGTYSGSWWYWEVPLTPVGLNGDEPMLGTWRFRAELDNGTADDVTFTVGGVVFGNGFE